MALREGLGPPPPQQTFVRWNDPYGTELIGINRDGTIYSFGLRFPDGTCQISSSGPTVQEVVTSSRAIGTVYQNTTGKPLYVYVFASSGVPSSELAINSDSSNPPTTRLSFGATTGFGGAASLFAVILPGNYYEAVNVFSTWTLVSWVEQY